MKKGADCLLWLDADHEFPRDALMRLLALDLPMGGCNYAKRNENGMISSASNMRSGRFEPVSSKPEGLEAVDTIGFGVALIQASVFARLPRPWFRVSDDGEDGYFCAQARAHGIQPYVDHSIKVGHIAETVLSL